MLGVAAGSQKPHAVLQAGRRMVGKLPGRRGPGNAGQEMLNKKQCGPGGQGGLGLYQQQSGQQDQGSNHPPVLSPGDAVAEETGVVYPGDIKVQVGLHHLVQLRDRRLY